ncbi:MAG: fibronectin type III domain-containing protein, partial [Nocardioides sp.]|uniref:fibronectin type III domain-containing protein n=1 Tax=Nocardioides sp. TaxID=35761 RepID=UPI003F094277
MSLGPGPRQRLLSLTAVGALLAGSLATMSPASARSTAADELADALHRDETLQLDSEGRLYAVDPVPPLDRTSLTSARQRDFTARSRLTADATADVFALHSRPGASSTVFLDFDGVTVDFDNAWVDGGLDAGTYEGWDPNGDGPAITGSEESAVAEVWARVAEDFAPFDIDVTTEQPDGDWRGAHAVISASASAREQLCENQCGGAAHVDVWGGEPTRHPAWTLTHGWDPDSKAVADATSHEVGHILSLLHHGTSTADLYTGHGYWGPIMGSPYARRTSLWSNGSYADANNPGQDDIARIAAKAGTIPDEPDTVVEAASAAAGTSGRGTIADRDDLDVFDLGECGPGVAIGVRYAEPGPNLKLEVRLLDASGATQHTIAPASQSSAYDTVSVPTGRYFLQIDGIGDGSLPTPLFDEYGSVGAYDWNVTGCDEDPGPTIVTPSAPASVTATHSGGIVTVNWQPPTDDGGSPVTQYRVRVGDQESIEPANWRSTSFAGLGGGTHDVSVSALNIAGYGDPATTSITTPAAPTEPVDVTAVYRPGSDMVHVTWSAPLDDGGSPITGYTVQISDQYRNVGADAREAQFADLAPGRYDVRIAAINAGGQGEFSTVAVAVDVTVTDAPVKVRPVVRV